MYYGKTLLLCGPTGMGKGVFAQCLAEALLCETPLKTGEESGSACGHCKPCHLLQAKTHPDLLQIQPADVGKQISIDQIRHLIQFCVLTAHYGRYQIIIIKPAEAMNRNASNSLLKLLEEPPPKTLIMLVSHQPMALMATIRSRCYDIRLLLNLSSQAPFAALALANDMTKRRELFDSLAALSSGKNDPVHIAEGWSQLEVVPILQWMLSGTRDMIRYAMTAQTHYLVNHDYQEMLQRFARQFDLHSLFKLLDLQTEAYQLVTSKANVKAQGLLESIAIAWFKSAIRRRK